MDIGDSTIIRIEQVQTTQTLFGMPLDIRIVSVAGDTSLFTVWNNPARLQSYVLGSDSLPFSGVPFTITLDPNNKVLKSVSYQVLDAISRAGAL